MPAALLPQQRGLVGLLFTVFKPRERVFVHVERVQTPFPDSNFMLNQQINELVAIDERDRRSSQLQSRLLGASGES